MKHEWIRKDLFFFRQQTFVCREWYWLRLMKSHRQHKNKLNKNKKKTFRKSKGKCFLIYVFKHLGINLVNYWSIFHSGLHQILHFYSIFLLKITFGSICPPVHNFIFSSGNAAWIFAFFVSTYCCFINVQVT